MADILNIPAWEWLREPIPGLVLFLFSLLVISVMVTRRTFPSWWTSVEK